MSSPINLNVGLSAIRFQPLEGEAKLPTRQNVPPNDVALGQHLQRLMGNVNLQAAFAQAVRPHIGDKRLLEPHMFKKAVGKAKDDLKKAKDKMGDQPGSAEVGELLDLLDQMGDFDDTLSYYRQMLIPG